MRYFHSDQITAAVKEMCLMAAFVLPPDVRCALEECMHHEKGEGPRKVLGDILENAEIARRQKLPICQDTGLAFFWVELGQEACIKGISLQQAIDQGVRLGYSEGNLRKSVMPDPLQGGNTGDNTPSFVHVEMVPGDSFRITHLPKGCGSENMSRSAMLFPAVGVKGVEEFVIETVKNAGANACPPLIVGVGIGGNFEMVSQLAKKALLRDIGSRNTDEFHSRLEKELLDKINKLNIGPAGMGGRTTALEVFIEKHPCHIASLPVAVNLQCHAARKTSVCL
jgi:fumarate hydratase subunit alpha